MLSKQNMRAVINATVILFALATGCSTSSVGPPLTAFPEPRIENIATKYTSFRKVTDKEVYVNPELAMLCRGASQAEVEAARIKHGPHANTAILVYMNEPAAGAFSNSNLPYPVGAVIVKRKIIHGYSDPKSEAWIRSADNGVGGMVKRQTGFDPLHGDWEYFYFESVTENLHFERASNIESGRINSCVQCHETAKNTDYVFGTWRHP